MSIIKRLIKKIKSNLLTTSYLKIINGKKYIFYNCLPDGAILVKERGKLSSDKAIIIDKKTFIIYENIKV